MWASFPFIVGHYNTNLDKRYSNEIDEKSMLNIFEWFLVTAIFYCC